MARRLFNPEKLNKLFEPQGFSLNLPESFKNGISFVRPSSIERLYEHVLICAANPVCAEVAISAASFTTCLECVSERDDSFRVFLARAEPPFHASTFNSSAEAKLWQKRLVENADAYCVSIAAVKGPALARRLQPVFNAVDAYVQRLGDIFAILDREFAFFTEASPDERREAEQLVAYARTRAYLDSEDSKLASLALIRFGADVERGDSPFRGMLDRRGSELAARLVLLVDFVRSKRFAYANAGGLYRLHRPQLGVRRNACD